MNTRKIIAALLLLTASIPALADCKEECKTVFEDCKAENDSPNGEKICGSDYHECVRSCAEQGL